MDLSLQILVYLVIYVLRTTEAFPKVTNPPVSMTAFVDTWVSFHCEGEGDTLVWQTSEGPVTDEIKESRNIFIYYHGITTPGIVNSTLVILAKYENDGLFIGCIIFVSSMIDSAGANLYVKAIGPVEDVFFNISMNEYAIVVWSPPSFVADDVNSLSYRVVIKDDNDNALVDIVTTEWEYEVSIDILNLCSIYSISVTADDNTYFSDSSIIQEEYIGEYSASIVDNNISVEETGNFTVEFTIKLEGNPRLCNSVIRGKTRLSNPVDEYNHETEHDLESIETNNDIYIAKYTVRNLDQQLNCIFDCQIEDTLNNIKDTVHQKFTTNHVQDFTAYVHENGSIYVQCIFANNSNASGCGLNFTEREDTTVTLYSADINKIQGSVETSGYINLPIGGNLTVIAFDILNDEVSDKPAVIYNELPEIEVLAAKPIPTSIVNIVVINTYFSSSSYHSDSDNVQSTAILSVQISSIPTTEMKSPEANNVWIISGLIFFISFVTFVIIMIIVGILMFKVRRKKENDRKGVFEVVSPMAQDNTYDELVRGVRFSEVERSNEILEESDHEDVAVFLGGHRPNPPSTPQHSPSSYSHITHPAVTQAISDTSSPNHTSSYRSQTSGVSEDDNQDNVPYNDRDTPVFESLQNYEYDLQRIESTSSDVPLLQKSPIRMRSPPQTSLQLDDDVHVPRYDLVTNVEESPETMSIHSNNTHLSTGNENFKQVEELNNPRDLTIATHSVPEEPTLPVVVESETAKNKLYAELQHPSNPPRVPPPSDTNVTYSEILPHSQTKKICTPPKTSPVLRSVFIYDDSEASLTSISSNTPLLHSPPICQTSPKKLPPRDKKRLTKGIEGFQTEESNSVMKPKDSPPSYNEDVMIDKEPTTEFSTDYQTKGFLVFPAPKTRLPVGSHIIDGSIQFLDGTEDYHTDPHLAYNQEKEKDDIILPSQKDVCDTENKSDGNRHGILPLSPPPEQENRFRLYPSVTEETPQLVVTSLRNEDLLEEENLSDDRQQVDSSDGQLVTPEFYRKDWMSFLVTCKFPEAEIHVKNKEESEIEAEENKKRGHNTEDDGPTEKWQTTRDSLTTSVLIKAKLVSMGLLSGLKKSVGMQVKLATSGILKAFKIKLEITQKAFEHKKRGNLTWESINETEVPLIQWAALSISKVVPKMFFQKYRVQVGISYNPVKCGLLAYCLSGISSVFVSYFPT